MAPVRRWGWPWWSWASGSPNSASRIREGKPKPKKPTPTTSSTTAEGRLTPSFHPPAAAYFTAAREAARVATLLMWPPNGIPSFSPRMPPTPRAWDGEPAAHRRRAAPRAQGRTSPDHNPPTAERYAQVMARIDTEYPPTAEARCRAIKQAEVDDCEPQTARWSGGGPGRGRRQAPRVQGCHSPTAEYHACTIARLEATVDDYTRALEQAEEVDNEPQTARWSGSCPSRGRGHTSRAQEWTPPERKPPPVDDYVRELERMEAEGYGPQTARWSGSGPSHGCGHAPRTDTAGRTQPRVTARQGRGYPM
jgi:hypothetical protein